MLYTEIKELFNSLDKDRELVELVVNNLGSDEFEDNNHKFIKESEVFDYVKNNYEADEYMLGCFTSWFIADNTDLDIDIVEALQSAEKFEAIGKHIIDNNFLDDFISEYIRLDGYGSALSTYDGNYEEIEIQGADYIHYKI